MLFKSKLAKNTVSSVILKITMILCGFIIPRMILKAYGSELNGLVNSITQFLSLISFLELGVGAVVQSSLYKPLIENNNIQISMILSSAQKFFNKLGVILIVYLIFLVIIYPSFIKQNYSFLFSATLIIAISISLFAQYFFGLVNAILLNSDQRGYISFNIQTVTIILNTIVCYLLIEMNASIHLVKFISSFVFLIRPVYIMNYVKKNYQIDKNIQYFNEPIKQKWNGVAQHIAFVALDVIPVIILTIFSTLNMVSVFSVYNLIVQGIKSIILSFANGSVLPLLGQQWAKQDINKLRITFAWSEWGLHTCTTLVFGITFILIVPFINVYTSGINDTEYLLPFFGIVISIANAMYCYRLPYNIMILAGGHYKETQKSYIFAVVINIVISIVCVKLWNVVGVSIGMLSAMLCQTIWMALYNSKNLVRWPMSNFLKQMYVNTLTMILIYILTKNLTIMSISYHSWCILALNVTLISCLISLFVNLVFYKDKIMIICRKIWYKTNVRE